MSSELRNIEQVVDDNTGGVEAVWYVPVEQVLSLPAEDEPLGMVVLRPGATWYQLVATQNTVRFTEPDKTDRAGTYYQPKLTGVIAKNTAALAAGISGMSRHLYLVLHRDANGQVWLVGSLDEPLRWNQVLDTGNSANDRNQRAFTFATDTTQMARAYFGTWQVSGLGLESGLDLQQGSGGTVVLRSADGRVLATVQAGRTVVLKSGFKLSYQII